jgi:hypothetical protein
MIPPKPPEQAPAPRRYPALPEPHVARRPISFVTVHFSGDLAHNLARSECVADPCNELIVVDNRHNLSYDTLGQALEAGIARARHDLVALVHEDVLLLPGWQACAERALAALEQADPDWAFAGAAGWLEDGTPKGHWSDPHGYSDHLGGAAFAEVDRIDEQLIFFRRDRRIALDGCLPSIHNIGRDLPRTARAQGRRTYVVDAPTVHKHADAEGRPILRRADSPKIAGRTALTYRADLDCSDRYFRRKWAPPTGAALRPRQAPDPRVDAPIILLARGGGGSRLLSVLAQDAGVHLGASTNVSGDALGMVPATYGLVLSRFRYQAAGLLPELVEELRGRAAAELLPEDPDRPWGYKLPESLLILEQIDQAFPGARYVHLLRDPLATCLRRTHMTARFDNQVGQASLLAAYRHLGLGVGRLATDSPAMHMAATTLHQLDTALAWTRQLPPERLLELRFEDVLADPLAELARLRTWLGCDARGTGAPRIAAAIDRDRAERPQVRYSPEEEAGVAAMLAPLRRQLGYIAA